jgi:hypothetical protein
VYIDPRPDTAIGKLRTQLFRLIEEHRLDGMLPTSARFLFYELLQRSIIAKHSTGARRADQNLHDALTDLREAGHVPWQWIVDETRSLDDFTGSIRKSEGRRPARATGLERHHAVARPLSRRPERHVNNETL